MSLSRLSFISSLYFYVNLVPLLLIFISVSCFILQHTPYLSFECVFLSLLLFQPLSSQTHAHTHEIKPPVLHFLSLLLSMLISPLSVRLHSCLFCQVSFVLSCFTLSAHTKTLGSQIHAHTHELKHPVLHLLLICFLSFHPLICLWKSPPRSFLHIVNFSISSFFSYCFDLSFSRSITLAHWCYGDEH